MSKTVRQPASPLGTAWQLGRRHALAVIIVGGLLVITVGGLLFVKAAYADTVFPRVQLGGQTLSGASREAVRQHLETYVSELSETGLRYIYQTEETSITPLITATGDPDLSYQLLNLDVEASTEAVFAIGHTGQAWRDTIDLIGTLLTGRTVIPVYEVDSEKLIETLRENFSKFDDPAANPIPLVQSTGVVSLTPEHAGTTLDYEVAAAATTERLRRLSLEPITLASVTDLPEIALADTLTAQEDLRNLVATLPWEITYEDKRWAIGLTEVSDWFIFTPRSGGVAVDFNTAAVEKYLTETVAPQVNIEAKEGKFSVTGGRVTEFQASQTGRTVNVTSTLDTLRDQLLSGTARTATVAVTETKPVSQSGNVNALGIKELVGVGRTNFKGSPKNRVHNLTVGANAINGLLIKPGEEFSLIKALIPIDASNGYLPELVIKGNRTTPEYGGGLCQIGTTLFRAVLSSGLPVLERQNHSYRVSYYEPPVGMDATIYDPKPDFRFKNDYTSSLLIQTRIEGTELIFEFYGTKDGRTASTTEPKIYNVVKPGPTKIIETTDLKPGEKNCTEKAHNGSDAEFTYTVKYPDGRTEEKLFKSHYKVWPAVCLVGKAADAPKPAEPTNQNTNANVNSAPTNVNAAPVNTNAAPANTNTNSPANTNQ